MPKLSHVCLAVGFALGCAPSLVAFAATPASKPAPAMSNTAMPADPYLWLEGVEDPKALEWVRERNAKAEAEIAGTPEFQKLEGDLRAILDSTDRIPGVTKIGDYYYNFWRDKANPRGLWRRTTLDEYRKPAPKWETVIDLDALNAAEGRAENEKWVWHGAECLKPKYERCLIALSRGGADADVTREFDLTTKTWVEDGFFRPEAKGGLQWVDRDTVYVYTDFGDGSLTSSGYPRVVKEWKRGTPMASAKVVYEGKPTDMYIAAYHDLTPGYERSFVSRTLAFYNDELYLRGKDGKLVKLDVPNTANKSVHNQWLTLELREPWKLKDREYAAGSLLVIDFDKFMAGNREFDVVFTPDEHTSLSAFTWTKQHLVVTLLNDVKSKIRVLTPLGEGGWKQSLLDGVPAVGTTSVSAVDPDDNDLLWMTTTDYLTPTTLLMVDIGQKPEKLKAMPAFFDAEGLVTEQQFATSKDGTKVPYFIVRRKDLDLRRQGTDPALRLRRLRGLADARLQRHRRPRLAAAGRRVRARQHPRRRRIRSALAPGRAQGQPPQGLRGLRGGRRRPVRAQDHLAQAPRRAGRQQRRPADGQHDRAVSAAVRRHRLPGAAARHEALQPPAGRRLVDGRIRRPGHEGLGVHPDTSRRTTC